MSVHVAMPEAAGSASAPEGVQSDDDARKEKLRKAGQEYFEKVLAQVMHSPPSPCFQCLCIC